MDALAAELGAHRGAALADEGAVPPVCVRVQVSEERRGRVRWRGSRGGRIDFPMRGEEIRTFVCWRWWYETYAGNRELPSTKRTPTGLSEIGFKVRCSSLVLV